VKTQVIAINEALNEIQTETDGFSVDLTPPELVYLYDGTSSIMDRAYQVHICLQTL